MNRRPDAPVFFIDRDLGSHFAAAVSADGRFGVEPHDIHFPDEAPDDAVWLQLIANKGWIGVTHDKKLKQQHREVIARHGARVIIVVGNRPIADQAANFLTTYPRIQRFVRDRPGPYTAKLHYPTPTDLKKLSPKGRIELWGK